MKNTPGGGLESKLSATVVKLTVAGSSFSNHPWGSQLNLILCWLLLVFPGLWAGRRVCGGRSGALTLFLVKCVVCGIPEWRGRGESGKICVLYEFNIKNYVMRL